MIINAEEYYDMGFTASSSAELEGCLKRAEYTIAALTEGRYETALAAGGKAAEYVKQAAAFQTYKLVKEQQQAVSSGSTEKVAIGDYSYTSTSEQSSASAQQNDSVYDLSMQTVRLLRASGCLFGGREVR
ncbi:MAG: hypothetical protein E7485_09380 [Ruminococcaceae bacterium]|nr:hypothetical protein [Oscillospiraceae bacterium]